MIESAIAATSVELAGFDPASSLQSRGVRCASLYTFWRIVRVALRVLERTTAELVGSSEIERSWFAA
jgi:hypothetical protein